MNQQVAVALLRRSGHTVDVAADGEEAIGAVRSRPYDLVFMDVRMPVLDGLTATRRIRALPGPAARVPIVAMTANAMAGDEAACLAAGMDGYVAKPVDRQRLDEAVARWTAAGPSAPPPNPGDPTNGVGDDDPLIDREIVAELEDALGGSEVALIAARFFTDVAERLRRLRDGLAAGRRDIATEEAHAIKGGAGALGFARAERLAAALEQRLRAGRSDGAEALASRLAEAVAATRRLVDDGRQMGAT